MKLDYNKILKVCMLAISIAIGTLAAAWILDEIAIKNKKVLIEKDTLNTSLELNEVQLEFTDSLLLEIKYLRK